MYSGCEEVKDYEDKLLEILEKSVETSKVFVALYNGKLMKSKSGKTAWNSLQAAKLAIRYTVACPYYKENFDTNKMIKKLEDEKIITYEQIEKLNGGFK